MSEIEYVTGHTYEDCIKKLQSLYGSNFQPIKKRFVNKGGFLGFFQHEMVQVSYVVTEQMPSLFSSSVQRRNSDNDFEKERAKILEMSKSPVIQNIQRITETSEKTTDEEEPSYQKILDEMKSLREDFAGMKGNVIQEDEPESIVKIREILENNEFSPVFVRSITEKIRKQFSLAGLEDFQSVQDAVMKWIEESIEIDDIESKEQPKIIILVGPTGVGKTTTVAKLAAKYAPSRINPSRHGKVHIITIDNYRIAGKDQIVKYGEIMGISVDECSNAEEVTEKVQKYSTESDLILIDTIGFSPRDSEHMGKMKETLQLQGYDTVVYLAMMASTKATDMREIMNQYELFGYNDVIITKLDETGCVGNLISIVSEKGKKFAYYTTGQRVPADIEKASVSKLMSMLREFTIRNTRQEQMLPAE